MITRIENALIAKLQKGLGHLVAQRVTSYASELSYIDPSRIVRIVPAVWVNFAGITNTQAVVISRKTYRATAVFNVIVAVRNVRDEQSQRHGGASKWEIGANQLVYAVRRLLTNQDLTDIDPELEIDFLYPKRVRSLSNQSLEKEAIAVYACEFQTFWNVDALDNNRFPSPEVDESGEPKDPKDEDNVFIDYGGETSEEYPEFTGAMVDLHQDLDKDPDMSFIVDLKENKDEQN